ncbi:MAG: hypothetical protein K9J06_08265 [Flavobacteriales bacterium]|nr:hypothetical protein [Flavobacteriales bacterium]
MENEVKQEKKSLKQKLLAFQKMGLVSYGAYLTEQDELASRSDSKKAYRKYIQRQMEKNNQKIAKIDSKLK